MPRPLKPLNEDALELLVELQHIGKARAWMTRALRDFEQVKAAPFNDGIDDQSAAEVVFDRWGFGDRDARRLALDTFLRFLDDRGLERRWYAEVKRNQERIEAAHGPLQIDDEDIAIYKMMEAEGKRRWMSYILSWAESLGLENEGESFDPSDHGMLELYYVDVLANYRYRSFSGKMADRFRQYVKNRSFERRWYAAVEKLMKTASYDYRGGSDGPGRRYP